MKTLKITITALLLSGLNHFCFAQESIVSSSILIPKGNSVSIDGVMEKNEWTDAKEMDFKGGGFTLFKCDESYLYLCIQGDKLGISSVAINTDNKIYILHASTSIITAIYEKDKDTWKQLEEFHSERYALIKKEKDAKKFKDKFLSEFLWFANTLKIEGKPDFNLKYTYEYKISLDLLKNGLSKISIVFFQRTAKEQYARLPIDLNDESIGPLARSVDVPILNFNLEKWITLNY